jgi:alpha-glucosidase
MKPWWKAAVLYQIYPRSFQDSDGDGVGDLRGLTARLPYLCELGVDALWLSPIFASPMADFGYDISNYTSVDPLFGTIDDFDALLAAAHGHGLKLLLDFVPNHTSDQHPWFQDSRASRASEKRDWYIWRDPAPGGGPPNNWLSEFGGSAWAFDEVSGQYYYHAFLSSQPDLNWRNAQVRSAMHEVMRFWLKRGVDGFRVDVIWHLIKDDQFRDNPTNTDFREGDSPYRRSLPLYSTDRPEVHDLIRELRSVIDEFPERLLIGEIYLPLEKLVTYYGRDLSGAHMPFNFSLLETPWNPRAIAELIERYEELLPKGGWPNWVLGNHDRPRVAARLGIAQTRIAAMLLLTLRGTPTLYYGDEIGMPQVAIPPKRIRDPAATLSRDGCRTPMQWDGGVNAGFSTANPWLPLAKDFADFNVASQQSDPGSLFNLYRRLVRMRRERKVLTSGVYRSVASVGDILAYEREADGDRVMILLNFSQELAAFSLPGDAKTGIILVSTCFDREGERAGRSIVLQAHEGLVIALGS